MAGFNPTSLYNNDFDYNTPQLYDGFRYPGPNNSDWKIELAVDLSANGIGDWFTLDDPTKGVLDNSTYLLAGDVFVDITRWVRQLSVSRGRSRRIGTYTAGNCSFVLDNRDRIFDPLMEGSPFYGSIIPRKEVRVFYKNTAVFIGNVEDWDFSYNINGDSIAIPACVDATGYLSRLTYPAATESDETSVERFNTVLDAIGWPSDARKVVEHGAIVANLYADTHDDVSALTYLQSIETSELGNLFVNRVGHIEFHTKPIDLEKTDAIFGEGGIPFFDIQVAYETDQMTNSVKVNYAGGSAVTIDDATSQDKYGMLSSSITTLLYPDSYEPQVFGLSYLASFKDPAYYVDQIKVNALGINSSSLSQLLNLDLRDKVLAIFRPNNTGEPQTYELVIDGIQHDVSPSSHVVTLKMSPPVTVVEPELGI